MAAYDAALAVSCATRSGQLVGFMTGENSGQALLGAVGQYKEYFPT